MMKKILITQIAILVSVMLYAQTDILPPQLVFPADLAVKQMPDTELNWYASAGVGEVTYRVELDEDAGFSNPVVFNTDLSAQKLEDLFFGHTYYWHVKAIDDTGESEWSDDYSFTVISRIVPNKPNDGEVGIEPDGTITWKPSISGTPLSGLIKIQCMVDTAYQWSQVMQEVTSDNLFAFSYPDGNAGWAVGAGGTILFYDGTELTEQTSPSSDDLFAIDMLDANNGWAVGESGTILYFDGTEWTEQTNASDNDLFGIMMIDENMGYAVGDDGVIVSFNGTEWTEEVSPVSSPLAAIDLLDGNNIWAVGEDGIIIYFDGTTWTEQTSPSTKDLYCISFVDANNGWIGGKSGTVLFFNGTEWVEIEIDSSIDIKFLSMLDAEMGIAGGKEGLLLEYDGSDWVETASGSLEFLNGVGVLDADNIWIVGDAGTMIMKSEGAFTSPLARIFSKSADSSKLALSELFFGMKYFWKIRGIHATDTSDWSSAQHFYTIGSPVNVTPTNNAVGQMLDLTVEWEEISGVFEYIVELCDDPNFSTPCMYFSDENSFTPAGLLLNKTYYWHVKAAHTQDTSAFSETWSFETLNMIELISPENESHVSEIFATLTWQELSGLGGVQLYYDTDPDFTMTEMVDIDGPESSYQIPYMLVDDETYYWKVRAYENGDTTNWSATWSFIMGEVGINELNKHNVKLFPNPNNGMLNIEVGGNVQGDIYFSISNVLGEIILNEKYTFAPGTNNRRINLSDFENGLYIVQFKSGNSVYTQKVVLDR